MIVNKRWETALTVTLVACAVITTGLVIRREFMSPENAPAEVPAREPEFVKEWQSFLDKGELLGSAQAPVQLIEFADFECPFCARFTETLHTVRERYPDKVAVTFIHLPLEMHRFAEISARAAECADEQGRFEQMHDLLFKNQRTIGIKPWTEFAQEAGVPDTDAFDSCFKRTDSLPRVEAGKALAETLNVRGTPTLMINGWKLDRPPSVEELDRKVQAVLAGKPPV